MTAAPKWETDVVEAMTRAADLKLTAVSINPDSLMQFWQAFSDTKACLSQRDKERGEIPDEAVMVEEDRNQLLRAMEDIQNSGSLNGFPEDAVDTLAWIGKKADVAVKESERIRKLTLA